MLDVDAAPAIPAATPPVASAPATIVAPSIFEKRMGGTSWWVDFVLSMVRGAAKGTYTLP